MSIRTLPRTLLLPACVPLLAAVSLTATANQSPTTDAGPASEPAPGLARRASPAPTPSAQPQLAVTPNGALILSWMSRVAEGPVHPFEHARLRAGVWSPATLTATWPHRPRPAGSRSRGRLGDGVTA